MYLKEQIYVLEIYKQQSLSKAAERLHISQPALSNFLNHLEQNLGIALFVREKRRLVPTEAGKIYIDIAVRMVRLQEKFYLRLNPLLKSTPCVLRIGIQRIRGASMIPKILQFFAEKYPK
ncbi:MAG: LysR family transcriptional regulator, partial [Clostridium sp.]|nr:LysR family transcriptional regulator [Clostridium sp.]